MALDPTNSSGYRTHDPWLRFTQRNEQAYKAEDSRLCPSPSSIPEIIKRFMSHGYTRLTEPIPHQRRILKEFLSSALSELPGGHTGSIGADVHYPVFNVGTAALLDDRHDHARCTRLMEITCNDERIESGNLSVSKLYESLHEKRRNRRAERRVLFIPNMTSIAALVIASAIAPRSTISVRDMMHRYLTRECLFSVSTTWGFFLEFHIPYYAMRKGPIALKEDPRMISGKRLRKSEVLPLQHESEDPDELCYHEAQISSLCWGPDETYWTELFLVETFFGSEPHLETYLDPVNISVSNMHYVARMDPPTLRDDSAPYFDPREYWLKQLEVRLSQINQEYTALIGTFIKRMEAYVRTPKFKDDRSGHTQTLSDVLETVQTFIDSISSTLDAWETFRKNQISFFVLYVHNKDDYPRLLDNIIRIMGELERQRSLLLTQRTKFKSRIENFHTVSSLNQTETAIAQGENIRTLTQMTVYVAFPLLFTAAIFSMDFVNPKGSPLTWGLFFTVLFATSLLNGAMAWLLHNSIPQEMIRIIASPLRPVLAWLLQKPSVQKISCRLSTRWRTP